jgi:CheY-like chemotaxis protein
MVGPYLLLAEDDPDDLDVLREVLQQENLEIGLVCVNDGQKLIDFLENCSSDELPSLILLDYNMPLVTADQVLDELSRRARYSGIPKLVWSTSDKKEFVQRSLERGALAYLQKPASMFETHILATRISEVLRLQVPFQPYLG